MQIDAALEACCLDDGPILADYHLAPEEPPESPHNLGETTAAWWRDRWWLIAQQIRQEIQLREFEAQSQDPVSKHVLLDHVPGRCLDAGSCDGGVYTRLSLSGMQALVWEDELWLGFKDSSETDVDLGGTGRQPYRVVRVLPQCTYLSTLTKRLMGVPMVTAPLGASLEESLQGVER